MNKHIINIQNIEEIFILKVSNYFWNPLNKSLKLTTFCRSQIKNDNLPELTFCRSQIKNDNLPELTNQTSKIDGRVDGNENLQDINNRSHFVV